MKHFESSALVALFVVLLLGSCTTTPGTYVEPEASADAVAVVHGIDPNLLSELNPMRKLPGDMFPKIWILSVDGESLTHSSWSGWPTEVRVTPGTHTIGVKGKIEVEGTVAFDDEGEVSHYFRAGRSYQLAVDLIVGGLYFRIEEARD